MKKFMCAIFILLMTIFINVPNIIADESNVCSYGDGKKTTEENPAFSLTIDKSGNISIDQSIYDISHSQIKPFLMQNLESTTGEIKVSDKALQYQELELSEYCPKRIYMCEYEIMTHNTGLFNLFTEGSVDNAFIEKEIYLFGSEEAANSHSELKDLKNGEVKVGSGKLDQFLFFNSWCNVGSSIGNITHNNTAYWLGVAEFFITFGSPYQLTCFTTASTTALTTQLYNASDFYIRSKKCDWYYSQGDQMTYSLTCPNLAAYQKRYFTQLEGYDACKDDDAGCISQWLTIANETEDQIRNYCNSILSKYNYDGSDQQFCIEDCLNISNNIISAKRSVGLISDETPECGFSGRLLVWVSNILRWIKYILPVAVIILSILDFIKAIGSDKDDEMKKAQGKFIRRLIAAALVFIIPFVIEFILDKMGFGYNDCGLF